MVSGVRTGYRIFRENKDTQLRSDSCQAHTPTTIEAFSKTESATRDMDNLPHFPLRALLCLISDDRDRFVPQPYSASSQTSSFGATPIGQQCVRCRAIMIDRQYRFSSVKALRTRIRNYMENELANLSFRRSFTCAPTGGMRRRRCPS